MVKYLSVKDDVDNSVVSPTLKSCKWSLSSFNQSEIGQKQLMLYSVNKSRFSKNERKFFLKQAFLLMELKDQRGIS
jgi:hypothetical protein